MHALIGAVISFFISLTVEVQCWMTPRQARAMQRANCGTVTKLVKEVDKIIGTDPLTDDDTEGYLQTTQRKGNRH